MSLGIFFKCVCVCDAASELERLQKDCESLRRECASLRSEREQLADKQQKEKISLQSESSTLRSEKEQLLKKQQQLEKELDRSVLTVSATANLKVKCVISVTLEAPNVIANCFQTNSHPKLALLAESVLLCHDAERDHFYNVYTSQGT